MLTGTQAWRRWSSSKPFPGVSLLVFVCGSVLPPQCHAQAGRPELSQAAAASSNSVPTTIQGAQVTYSGGLLTVVATNASLNQVVQEIARRTGMKVTGRVAEERVFGTYGPEPPSPLLTGLLDGTGSNLLIVQNASHVPTELILTPRVGTPTPPNPNSSYANENGVNLTPQPAQAFTPPPQRSDFPSNSRSPARPGTGGIDTNPAATSPSSTSQQVVFPPIDATTPPATGTTTPIAPDASPATAKTPQQIFEQLQKLRQQQSQTPQATPQ